MPSIIAIEDKNIENEMLEKHIFYSFLKQNGLDYNNSEILKSYFHSFVADPILNFKLKDYGKLDFGSFVQVLEELSHRLSRRKSGIFFTPSYIVDFIINNVSPQKNEKCLDPCCGSGAFIIGILKYFKNKFEIPIRSILQNNIIAADISEENIRRTKIITAIFALIHNEPLNEQDFNFIAVDSLAHRWSIAFDIVVGNPPYVKYQDLTEESRSFLNKKTWLTTTNGTFNLYFAFFELGYKLLSTNGRLGYISPNNFFTSLSAKPLRAFFKEHKCVESIFDFGHFKVFKAQTYTAITIISKERKDEIKYSRLSEQGNLISFLEKPNVSINKICELKNKKWRLLLDTEKDNIYNIENAGTPIGKLFTIAVGIATLKDAIYQIKSGYRIRDNYFIINYNERDYSIEKSITLPLYKISNLKSEMDVELNDWHIIVPYHLGTTPHPIEEIEMKRKYPGCYEYLCATKNILETRDKGKKRISPFYAYARTQGLNRFGEKLLTPTFSKNPRFLKGAKIKSYFTNGYGIFFDRLPCNRNDLFNNTRHSINTPENISIVQKILNSIIMKYYIDTTSVAIQGGYPCYQKNFIEHFSIPNLNQSEITQLRKMNSSVEIDEFLIHKYNVKIDIK